MKYFYAKNGQYLGSTNDGSNIEGFHGCTHQKPEHGGMSWDNVNSRWEDLDVDSEGSNGSGAVKLAAVPTADGGNSGE